MYIYLSNCFLAASSEGQTSTGFKLPSLSGAHAQRQQTIRLLTRGHKGNIINSLTKYFISIIQMHQSDLSYLTTVNRGDFKWRNLFPIIIIQNHISREMNYSFNH